MFYHSILFQKIPAFTSTTLSINSGIIAIIVFSTLLLKQQQLIIIHQHMHQQSDANFFVLFSKILSLTNS